MNRILIFIPLILITALPAFSQSAEEDLDEIRHWFREVNENISLCRKVEYTDIKVHKDTNPDHYSMEAEKIYRLAEANMIKFIKDQQLVKVILDFNGDREDLTSEYYFKNGNLFFVDKTKTVYHKPKWDEDFSESEKSIAKDRFYIKNNRLIRWINPKGNSVGRTDQSFDQQEAMILNDYKLYTRIE